MDLELIVLLVSAAPQVRWHLESARVVRRRH